LPFSIITSGGDFNGLIKKKVSQKRIRM